MALLGFISRDESHLISELLVICSAYADIMRKVDRISAISDTMNIVLGQQHRYSGFRLYRDFLIVINDLAPLFSSIFSFIAIDASVAMILHALNLKILE